MTARRSRTAADERDGRTSNRAPDGPVGAGAGRQAPLRPQDAAALADRFDRLDRLLTLAITICQDMSRDKSADLPRPQSA